MPAIPKEKIAHDLAVILAKIDLERSIREDEKSANEDEFSSESIPYGMESTYIKNSYLGYFKELMGNL